MEYILIETLFSIFLKKTIQCFEISVFNLLGAKTGRVRSSIILSLDKKKNNALVAGNAGDEKHFQPGGPKKEYINFIEYFLKSLHLKKYSNSTFLC